jgi:hypothetical protein
LREARGRRKVWEFITAIKVSDSRFGNNEENNEKITSDSGPSWGQNHLKNRIFGIFRGPKIIMGDQIFHGLSGGVLFRQPRRNVGDEK